MRQKSEHPLSLLSSALGSTSLLELLPADVAPPLGFPLADVAPLPADVVPAIGSWYQPLPAPTAPLTVGVAPPTIDAAALAAPA